MIVGIGNSYRRDDAAGHVVAELLGLSDGVVRHSGEPSSLIALWSGVEDLVLVDAIAAGGHPGRVVVIDAVREGIPAGLWRSTHTLGPIEAVEIARALGLLPLRVTVIGIEGADFSWGAGLSPEVEAAVDEVVQKLSGAAP